MCCKLRGARRCQECSECAPPLDFYAKKVDLVLPSGASNYRTWAGVCISFLVVIATLFFLALELNMMFHENSFTMQSTLARNWYKYAANDDDSFRLAVGLVDLADKRKTVSTDGEKVLIPARIGKIEVSYRTKYIGDQNPTGSYFFEEI